MNFRAFSILAIILMVGFCISGVNAAKDVSINVNVPSSIKVGEDFTVIITLRNEETDYDIDANDDIEIRIYMDGVLVHEETYNLGFDLTPNNETKINISSTEFRVDGDDIWSRNLMDYECGDNKEIRVEVSGDVNDESDTDDMDIKPDHEYYELDFTISPENPKVTDKITVHVTDENDDDLKGAKVKFTRLEENDVWDYNDKYREKTTDRNGEVEFDALSDDYKFENDPYSKYQVDVWKVGEYCKVTKFFDTRRKLNITEIPSAMFVGKAIKVRIVDDLGNGVANANLAVNEAGYHETFKSDSGGYVSFTLENAGTYDLVASKTGYVDSDITSIRVNVRGTLGVSINPKEAVVGSAVKIVVTAADGSLLQGAKVKITKPDGTEEVKTTPETGQISYTPTDTGTYNVKVEEASHLPKEDSFTALNEFTLTLPEVVLHEDIPLIVKDQNGLLVEGTTVSISGTTIAGKTDSNGKFTFKLETPGKYTITVKKANFRDKTQTINTLGTLRLELSSKELEVDKTLTIKVFDSVGNEIKDAKIEITKPDGTKETIGKEYIPQLPGSYIVTASKANYKSTSDNFTANRLPLELTVDVKGTKIIATVTSKGEPLPNITVLIDTIFGGEKLITDEFGIVEVELVNVTEKMNVTISVNEPKYEPKSVEKEISPSSGIFNVIILLILILFLVIAVYLRLKKKGGVKKKTMIEKGKGISLSAKKKGGGLRGI